jgi:hypothetical protein
MSDLTIARSSTVLSTQQLRPYKTYVALLTQDGTAAPVATVLENTLGGTIVWSYVSTGSYRATLTGAFPILTTTLFMNSIMPDADVTGDGVHFGQIYILSSDQLLLNTGDGTTPLDGVLSLTPVEIRVYA